MATETEESQTVFGNYPAIGFVSIFYSAMDAPLSIWDKQERRGEIRRIVDNSDNKPALEIFSSGNIYGTYIMSPTPPFVSLGITLPHMVLVLKNMNRSVAFTLQIRDEFCKRRFVFCSSYRTSRVKTFSSYVPITLARDWNELSLDLVQLTRKTYGTTYQETVRIQVHANCRLRLIYFSASPLETHQAAQIMKGILANAPEFPKGSSGKDTQDRLLTKSSDSESSAPAPPTGVFIEKSLAWRKQLAASKAKSAVFGSEFKCDLSEDESTPDGSKSCPQLRCDSEYEILKLIEEELLNFDYEQYQLHEQQLEASCNENFSDSYHSLYRISKSRTQLVDSDYDSCEEVSIVEGSIVEGSIVEEGSTVEGSIIEEEVVTVNAGSQCTSAESFRDQAAYLEHAPEEFDYPTSEPLAISQSSQTIVHAVLRPVDTGKPSISMENISNGNIELPVKDLDEQLDQLDSVIQLLMFSYPNSATEITNTAATVPLPSPTASKLDQLKARIDEMKQKLSKLEENFDITQTNSEISSKYSRHENTIFSPPQLASATTSGILRAPGTETFYAKIKPKLSVRFASSIFQSNDGSDQNIRKSLTGNDDDPSRAGHYLSTANDTLLSALRLPASNSGRPKTN